jgi:hypothetical protein
LYILDMLDLVLFVYFRYAGLGAILLSGLVTVILVVLPREPKVSTEEQIAVVSHENSCMLSCTDGVELYM